MRCSSQYICLVIAISCNRFCQAPKLSRDVSATYSKERNGSYIKYIQNILKITLQPSCYTTPYSKKKAYKRELRGVRTGCPLSYHRNCSNPYFKATHLC